MARVSPAQALKGQARRTLAGVARLARRPKRVSAMMRVRDESLFLRASVESLLGVVDEIVIVDNMSADDTPEIIQALASRHPGIVRAYSYPHDVARAGTENRELTSTAAGRRSPRLLSNYYNWCLQRCHEPYLLKWDGDMVAAPAFAEAMARFKKEPFEVVWMRGVNVHPDQKHTIAPKPGDDGEFAHWYSPLTDNEPRLFPRLFASYRSDLWYCESLWSPLVDLRAPHNLDSPEPTYLHLKFCKADPFANVSAAQRAGLEERIGRGERLSDTQRAALARLAMSAK